MNLAFERLSISTIFVSLVIAILLCPVCAWGSKQFSVSKDQLDKLLQRANTEMEEGKSTKVIETLYEFERLADSPKSPATDEQRLSAYFLLASLHCVYNDFASAVVTYEKALDLNNISPDLRCRLWGSYALALCYSGNIEKAKAAVTKLEHMHAQNPYVRAYRISVAKGCIENRLGNNKKAANHFKTALSVVDKGKLDASMKLTSLSQLSEYYGKFAPDSALLYLPLYLRLSEQYHVAPMIAEARRGLVKANMDIGDTVSAMRHVDGYITVMDSVYQPSQYIALNSKRQNEHLKQAKLEIKDLEFTISWQKTLVIICLILIVVGVCAIFLGKNFAEMRKALYARNREIVELGKAVSVADTLFDVEVQKSNSVPANDVSPQACLPEQTANEEDCADAPDASGEHNDNHSARSRDLMSRIELVLQDATLYSDPDFSLSSLAKLVGSNTKYVSQAINECTGDNFRTYINKLRIIETRQRLTDQVNFGHLTIQTISESVGFRSSSNFIATFKKVTGLTPSVYIKMSKQES